LKRAYEIAPDDPVTQQMLVEELLTAIASDYATHRADVPLVSRLARDRDQQVELMRINAQGLAELGDRLDSWKAFLRLADYTEEEPVFLRIDSNYRVRSDRWISAQLGQLWAKASSDERDSIAADLAKRRPASTAQTTAEVRFYLDHFDELPGAGEVRLSLVNVLMDRSRAQEAEIELLKMIDSPQPAIQSEARALLSRIGSQPGSQTDSSNSASAARQWPRGRVQHEFLPVSAQTRERSSRAQAEGQVSMRELRIEQDFWPQASATHWFVSTDCTQLLGRNRLGTDVLTLRIDRNNAASQYRENNLIHGAQLGRLLFVSVGGEILAVDSRQEQAGVGELLWESSPLSAMTPSELRNSRGIAIQHARSTRPVYHSWSSRKRVSGAAGAKSGGLGPVTPRGVIYHQRDELRCVDPLTGELLWVRTDIPAGCELFGDDELVFAADVRDDLASVIRISDGELVGKREFSKQEWLVTAGRNIAQLGRGNRLVRITDVWEGKSLFEAEFKNGTAICVVDPDALAVYEPSGKFQFIDVHSGRVVFDQQLEPMTDLRAIYTKRIGDELYLFVANQSQDKQFMPIGQPDSPLFSGFVYAYSITKGKPLWPSPAIVRNRGIVLSAPADIPLLVFADRKAARDPSTGGGSKVRVLCLDKRTGQSVYGNDNLPDTPNSRFRVRVDTSAEAKVALETGSVKILLTMTDQPRPPQPPANDDLEAPPVDGERGLRGIGRRLSGALRGALENPDGSPNPAEQQPPGQIQQGGALDAPDAVPEIDDD
jgi:hypothetical protein